MSTIDSNRLPIWIHTGVLETEDGEKLTFEYGVCQELGCAVEIDSGTLTPAKKTTVAITPKRVILSQYFEGVLTNGAIIVPSALRLLKRFRGKLSIPVKDGAQVKVWQQLKP